jgi:Fe-S cluster biogenesis protein NfuA
LFASKSTAREQIITFLQQNKPRPYCDDCIGKRINPQRDRHYVEKITVELGSTSKFQRVTGQCSGCSASPTKFVTNARLKDKFEELENLMK